MKIKQTKLKNGLRIVTVPMPGSPTVTVMVMVAAGARYETEKTNGLSHFLEHMCFKGTKTRTCREIMYELDGMGATTNAFTSYDMTAYHTKGPAKLFPKLLDIVADVYLNSTFPAEELEKERGVICGEIDMYEDMPKAKVGYTFLEAIYGNQPAGRTIIGPKENILKFTRKDFLDYHKTHYHAGKTVIVVAGDINQTKAITEIKKAFADIPTGKIIKKQKIKPTLGSRVVVENKKTDQSHIIVGMKSVPLGHADYLAWKVLNGVLGGCMSSRLFIKLREEMGAGYYVGSDLSGADDTGEFGVDTGTTPKRTQEVIKAIMGEIDKFRTEKVSAKELIKTKEFMVGSLARGLELSNNIAGVIAQQAIYNQPLQGFKEKEKEIRKITAEDILRVAKKYLKPENLRVAVIGPHTRAEIEKSLK